MPGLWMLKTDNMTRGRNKSCILIGDKSHRRAPANTYSPFYGVQSICVAVGLLRRKRGWKSLWNVLYQIAFLVKTVWRSCHVWFLSTRTGIFVQG